ncbi:hypothetical protein [Promicromonospora sukumoe]|uniref:hypothetical protein n=1 Tax=Promicromonospora sukumoe TaxID=88382 RepID=UPI003648FB1D
MLAIAPGAEPSEQPDRPRDRPWNEPVDLPLASSGDPTFASRTAEFFWSTFPDAETSRPS